MKQPAFEGPRHVVFSRFPSNATTSYGKKASVCNTLHVSARNVQHQVTFRTTWR